MYSKYCSVAAEKIDVCPNVGWIADFGDPQDDAQHPFNGNLIVQNGTNSNWGLVNHPKNKATTEAGAKVDRQDGPCQAWAEIDRELVEKAMAVPYEWEQAGESIECKTSTASGQLWNTAPGTTLDVAEVGAMQRREGGTAAPPPSVGGARALAPPRDARFEQQSQEMAAMTDNRRAMTAYMIRRVLWGVLCSSSSVR